MSVNQREIIRSVLFDVVALVVLVMLVQLTPLPSGLAVAIFAGCLVLTAVSLFKRQQ